MFTTSEVMPGYVETALWSSLDDDGDPLDVGYGPADLSDEATKSMTADVDDFLEMIVREGRGDEVAGRMSAAQFGHDFWLTRNRHGAGFWDRGLGELGQWLTKMAHPYGEVTLYVGLDELIHVA